jgi:ribulose-phosphate 3-epimerase
MNISTSLICCDLSDIKKDIDLLLDNGFNWLHADFMDGHFVPRYGISPELIQSLRRRYGNLVIIDSHMMVDDPYTYANVIAPYSDWYFFHYEAVKDPFRTLQMLRRDYPNLKIGLVFNLMTGTQFIDNVLYNFKDYIDGVMFMGISPGVLGTKSMPNVVENKLSFVQNYYPWCKTFVDGSVSWDTLKPYKDAGAHTVVCGSSTLYKGVGFDDNRASMTIDNINKIKATL